MQQTVGKKWRNCFQYIFWLITGTQSLPLLGKATKVMYKCVSRLKLDGKVGKKVQIILYSSNSKFVNGSSKYSILSLFGITSFTIFLPMLFFWFLAYCVYGGEAVEFCWGYCQFSGQECQVKVSISQENVGWRSKRRGKWQEWKWVEPSLKIFWI